MSKELTNIKEFYINTYSTDRVELEELNDNVTFKDLFNCLDNYKDIYKLLGSGIDSLVRERVFKELATIMGVNYDYIYNQWLLIIK